MIDKLSQQMLAILDKPIGGMIVIVFSVIVLSFILT